MNYRTELVCCFLWLSGCAGAAERAVASDAAAARHQTDAAALDAQTAGAETSHDSAARTQQETAPGPDTLAQPETPTPADSAPLSASPRDDLTSGGRPSSEGGLAQYTAIALENSPALQASFERWQASVHRIAKARRLPDPKLSFAYFVSPVETRVGPQRARLSLQQSFPWPTALTAGADAAAAQARAQQRTFEALALTVKQRVASAYYKLWLVREARKLQREHLVILRSLSETVLARVATGGTTLSDQLQIDLAAARLDDALRSMDEAENAASAELIAVLGKRGPPETPTPDGPRAAGLPKASHEELVQAVRTHPLLASFAQMAVAQDEAARAIGAQRLPSFTVGADWILTGEARMPDVPDSGKDALIVALGISVPLWQGSYGTEADAAHAEASAQRAEQRAAFDRAVAELESSLSAVRDAARRVAINRHTLIPQADAAYDSVLGAYAAGRATVAQTLMAQRDILDLRIELAKARADHAQAWARLESVAGRELAASAQKTEPASGASHAKE